MSYAILGGNAEIIRMIQAKIEEVWKRENKGKKEANLDGLKVFAQKNRFRLRQIASVSFQLNVLRWLEENYLN